MQVQHQGRVFGVEQGGGIARITQGEHKAVVGTAGLGFFQPSQRGLQLRFQFGRWRLQSSRHRWADHLTQCHRGLLKNGLWQTKCRQQFASIQVAHARSEAQP